MWIGWAVIIGLVVASVCGCRTVVPVREVVRDSIVVVKGDSTVVYRLQVVRDSVRVRDSLVVVVDTAGTEVRREVWHWDTVYRIERDSGDRWRARYDSVLAVRDSVRSVVVDDDGGMSFWDKVGIFGFFICFLLVIFFVVKFSHIS